MIPSVENLCDQMAERRLISSTDLARLRTRWFRPGRAEVGDVEKFGHWLVVNGYLTAFAYRLLHEGKTDLLHLNQYQLTDHLLSGPFAGGYLAVDPLQRHVVLQVVAADKAADPEALRAFQADAERAMSVRHPQVNLTLDFGEARGRHYLVREFDEGETLADVLARRGRLQPLAAARLFALVLPGLQALHDKQVPVESLAADNLLLSVAGKSTGGKSHTVKILNAGVPRALFDPAALDGVAPKAALPTAPKTQPNPQEDLFRLGITFYRCLTGELPFAADSTAATPPPLTPIRQRAADVPEVLAHLVESMLDADPAQRPRGAAQAAKTLRVFLASEEETRSSRPEEHLLPHLPAITSPKSEGTAAEAEQAPTEGVLAGQVQTLWQELRPGQRDWVFLSVGAAGVLVLTLFLTVLTGIHFVNLVCLVFGGALSFLVERLLHLRGE